ncbi:MAG TPA: ribosome assembly RNA-binding protein YhbY [Candidatus Binatia bacterium]|nr:ribosome assembly RNA-binding protein YhbY [Candidatus Binatia bacterium]
MSEAQAVSERAALTSTQRKTLRGMAHELEPVVHVGRSGINERVLSAVSAALDDHELIKVKLAADRDERKEMASQIEQGCQAELVGLIGGIAILYRPNPDPQKRQIQI